MSGGRVLDVPDVAVREATVPASQLEAEREKVAFLTRLLAIVIDKLRPQGGEVDVDVDEWFAAGAFQIERADQVHTFCPVMRFRVLKPGVSRST